MRRWIKIGGRMYRLEGDGDVWRVEREGGGGGGYDVCWDEEYGGTCTCRDFVYRREGLDGGGCKHLRALVTAGLLRGVGR